MTKNEGWRLVVANMTSFSVYMVVMHLKDNLTLGEFLMAIRHRPVALSLYIKVSLKAGQVSQRSNTGFNFGTLLFLICDSSTLLYIVTSRIKKQIILQLSAQ